MRQCRANVFDHPDEFLIRRKPLPAQALLPTFKEHPGPAFSAGSLLAKLPTRHGADVYLSQLTLGTKEPIMLVVDGHSIHRAKIIKEYVESTHGMLELHYLSPYSP